MDGLAKAAGHADRIDPLKLYCKGLLLPGERKSVEPMAARLAPDNVRRVHQSLHHLVADAPWSDEKLLAEVRDQILPALQKHGPVVAWIVDDTGFPKKGKHSVGVTRQYCGQLGKQDNCQVAVSLSLATWNSSLPVAYRLYLPEEWAQDSKRRQKAGVPEEARFQTKPQIALDQIQQAVKADAPPWGRAGGCRIRLRHPVSHRYSRTRTRIRYGGAVLNDGLATWSGTFTSQAVERPRTPTEVTAPR